MHTIKEPTWAEVDDQMRRGFEMVMQEVREKGLPIHSFDPAYPGEIVEEGPDGSRRIVGLDGENRFFVIRELPEVTP